MNWARSLTASRGPGIAVLGDPTDMHSAGGEVRAWAWRGWIKFVGRAAALA
jgi:hypothetical protein